MRSIDHATRVSHRSLLAQLRALRLRPNVYEAEADVGIGRVGQSYLIAIGCPLCPHTAHELTRTWPHSLKPTTPGGRVAVSQDAYYARRRVRISTSIDFSILTLLQTSIRHRFAGYTRLVSDSLPVHQNQPDRQHRGEPPRRRIAAAAQQATAAPLAALGSNDDDPHLGPAQAVRREQGPDILLVGAALQAAASAPPVVPPARRRRPPAPHKVRRLSLPFVRAAFTSATAPSINRSA